MTLSISAPADQTALMFASVFVIVWVGSMVVTANAMLLGASLYETNASIPKKLTPNRSFFQVVCLLGYSLAPMLVASILGLIVPSLIARSIFVSVGFLWSTLASVNFVAGLVPDGRKALAVYPICLFFMCISWMVLISGKRS